jgi:hypothetical protein
MRLPASLLLAATLALVTGACRTNYPDDTLIDEKGGIVRPAGEGAAGVGQALDEVGRTAHGLWEDLGFGSPVETKIRELGPNEVLRIGGLSVILAEEPGALQVVSVKMYGYHLAADPGLAGEEPAGDRAFGRARQLIFDGLTESDPEDRAGVCEESLAAWPTPGAWNNLGLARLQAGDRAEAEDALRKALELNPEYVPARVNLERLRKTR